MTQHSESADPTQAEKWFVATADSGTVEYSLDDLIPVIQTGRVSSHALVWRQGMSDWLEIEQVPLLRMVAVPVETEPKAVTLVDEPKAAAAVETEPKFAAPVAEPAPPVSKVEAVCSYPVLDEFEATVIQPRVDLLDDNAWTIEPKPSTPMALAAAVIQAEPDLLEGNVWTIEPKTKPAKAIAQTSPTIHELVKRGVPLASSSQPRTSKLPARPALVRPAAAKLDFTKNPPPQSSTLEPVQEVHTEPALLPALQIPTDSSPKHSQAAPNTPPPAEIVPAPRLASKAPPKPRSSIKPPAPERPSAKPQPPLPVKASTISKAEPIPAPAKVSTGERTTSTASQAPSKPITAVRESPPTLTRSSAVSPSPARVATPTSAQSMAHASLPVPSVQSTASAPTRIPAPSPAPLPAAVQYANTNQAPYSDGPTPDSTDAIGSLIPSVSTIYPDMPEWRKSRRPLVLAAGAIVAVAAAIFISFGVSNKKAGPLRPVAARVTAAAASELPLASPSAAPLPPDTAVEQAPPVHEANAQERKATPPSAKASKRALSTDNAPSAESSRSVRKVHESGARVANQQMSEPRASASESSAPSKPTPPSAKKENSGSPSVASWDQGTVEHRTWMNPGF